MIEEYTEKRDFILADTQEIMVFALTAMINRLFPPMSVSSVSSRRELPVKIRESHSPVIITDHSFFDLNGTDDLKLLSSVTPDISWLLLSNDLNVESRKLIRLEEPRINAVLKNDPILYIREAITATYLRRHYTSVNIGEVESCNNSSTKYTVNEKLTPSEIRVLREIALGKTTKQIARDRNLSFHTVNTHRRNIFAKLCVNNVQEAVRFAYRSGIVGQVDYQI